MPVEAFLLAIGGLVLAAVTAVAVRGPFRRPVDRSNGDLPAASAERQRRDTPVPQGPPSVVPVRSTFGHADAASDRDPFPGVGGRRLGQLPPPIVTIPTSALSPAARDRAKRQLAVPAVPVDPPAAAPAGSPHRRARRLGIGVSALGGAAIAAALIAATGSSAPDGPVHPGLGNRDAAAAETPGGVALVPPAPSGSPSSGARGDAQRPAAVPGGTHDSSRRGGSRQPDAAGSGPGAAGGPPGPRGTVQPSPSGPPPRPTSRPPDPTPRPPDPTPTAPPPTSTPAPETTPTPGPVTADFTVRVTGLTVRLTDHAKNAESWTWTFGDGAASTVRNPSHTYAAPGRYTIVLTVTGVSGGTATHSETVTVGG